MPRCATRGIFPSTRGRQSTGDAQRYKPSLRGVCAAGTDMCTCTYRTRCCKTEQGASGPPGMMVLSAKSLNFNSGLYPNLPHLSQPRAVPTNLAVTSATNHSQPCSVLVAILSRSHLFYRLFVWPEAPPRPSRSAVAFDDQFTLAPPKPDLSPANHFIYFSLFTNNLPIEAAGTLSQSSKRIRDEDTNYTHDCTSNVARAAAKQPTASENGENSAMAFKQSLVGIPISRMFYDGDGDHDARETDTTAETVCPCSDGRYQRAPPAKPLGTPSTDENDRLQPAEQGGPASCPPRHTPDRTDDSAPQFCGSNLWFPAHGYLPLTRELHSLSRTMAGNTGRQCHVEPSCEGETSQFTL